MVARVYEREWVGKTTGEMMTMAENRKQNGGKKNPANGTNGVKKRGRKPLGGLRIILRLTPQEVQVLGEKQKELGLSRTDLIRRAIDAYYFTKRRESDWANPNQS